MEKQKVLELMNSRYGDLAPQFIIEAIRHYSNQVANSDPSMFTNPLRQGQRWHSVAKEIKTKLERG